MRPVHDRARRGVVLMPVLVLLAAALLVALAHAARVRSGERAARVTWHAERALAGADAALLEALGAWSADSSARLRPGEVDTLAPGHDPTLRRTVARVRLSARRYLLHATAVVPAAEAAAGGAAMRDVALRELTRAVRLDWPRPPDVAVVAVFGALTLSDGAEIVGVDTEPPGWGALCEGDRRATPVPAVVADVVHADSTVRLIGALPAHRRWTAGERTTAEHAFDRAFAELAARASRTTSDSILDLDAVASPPCAAWFGDASRGGGVDDRCTRHWPIVYARGAGEITVRGARPSQGILLVDGDLVIARDVALHGLVLVRGRVRTAPARGAPSPGAPAGPLLSGLLLVRDAATRGSALAGGRIALGQCAARFSLASAARAVPEPRLGWHQRP